MGNIIMAEEGSPEQDTSCIIGTIQDVTRRMESELRYSNERQYRIAMLAGSRRVYEINVIRDRFIKLEDIEDTTDYEKWSIYSETMSRMCRDQIYKEDWEIFLRVATRENLLQGYKKGITEFYCEYRSLAKNGNQNWASSETHLLRDPITEDIKGFIYAKDINLQKRRELALYQQAERDSLKGAYNDGRQSG